MKFSALELCLALLLLALLAGGIVLLARAAIRYAVRYAISYQNELRETNGKGRS